MNRFIRSAFFPILVVIVLALVVQWVIRGTDNGNKSDAPQYRGTTSVKGVQPMTLDVLMAALDIKQRHGLSYWDSAIVAAALALGCSELYTEDMHHGLAIDGLRLINPFL